MVITSSAARIFNDYRRATGQMRQQLKWLAWVLMVGGILLLISMARLALLRDANQLAGLVLIVGSPIANGIAVTRNRLYEIDRIIWRTVTSTLVLAVLAGGVAVIATIVSAQFESPLVVAVTTLGVAAASTPLHRRIQHWVDGRFNRSKVQAYRGLDESFVTISGRFARRM